MKFAAIVPPQGLRVLERVGLGYHLCLAQYLLTDKAYRNYYKVLGRLGHFIIVDNGAAERDTPAFEQVVKVANYIGASEIVLPDTVFDSEATLRDTVAHAALVAPNRRFIVPQGRTWPEVLDSLLALDQRLKGQFATIGLSKYHWQYQGGRPELMRMMLQVFGRDWLQTKHIHMLGIGCDPFAEISDMHAVYDGVRGVDTGAPVAWAQRNRPLPDPGWDGSHIALAWEAPFELELAMKNILALAMHARQPQVNSEITDLPLMGRFGYARD